MIEDYNKGIEIYREHYYSLNSTDNLFNYKSIITSEKQKSLITNKVGIRCSITGLNVLLTSSGSVSSIHENCYVVKNNYLYICVGDTLFSIDNGSFELNWFIKADDATCFQVFLISDFILVHGELSVTAINLDGEIIWRFYGRDIFVTPDGIPEITFTKEGIKLVDWEHNEYLIDMDGKLL